MADLSLSRATYLGTIGADSAVAIAVSPIDGTYIVAVNFNGSARLQRFNTTLGTAAVSDIVLAVSPVQDMDVNRSNGQIATVGNFGIQVFDPTGTTLLWQQPGVFDRVAVANDGTVVTLNINTDSLMVWSAAGAPLAMTTLLGGDIRPADVAIDPVSQRIFVTGFTQVTPLLQTPFVLSFDRVGATLNPVWDTWNFTAAQVLGAGLAADTRGLRIEVGADNGLYFLGKTDGGNTVFTRDGEDINTNLGIRLVNTDQYTNTSNAAGAATYTFYAKLNSTNGTIERGQILVTRLTNGQANSFNPSTITADATGNVYLGGSSAFSLQNRNAQTINGQPVGSYTLGEPAIFSVSPDFQTRRFWTPLTRSGDLNGAVGSIAGFAIGANTVAFLGTITSPDVATLATDLNPNALGSDDVYLAILGNTPPVVAMPLTDQAATATTFFQYTIAAGSFTDANNDILTLTATLTGGNPLPAWLIFDPATLTFSGTPATGDVGLLSIDVTANDGFGGTIADTFVLTIAPAPIVPIIGSNESETLVGTANPDQISGFGGHDILSGGSGNDDVFGGEGNDRLHGDEGNDNLYGEQGNDQLYGEAGADNLFGGEGDDLLYGGDGADLLRGGSGNDQLTGNAGADIFVLAVGEGIDVVRDFRLGEDYIGLANGLTVGQLSIIQRSSQTWIRDTASAQLLARLEGVNAASLIAQSGIAFIPV